MNANGTLLLSRQDVRPLLSITECIDAVERVFRLYGEGKTGSPGILGIHSREGGFHIKAGLLEESKSYFVAKLNANFPQNTKRFKLPTIQGVIVLSDGENGYPLAIIDSIEITIQRTGAATAVAAKYLSRTDAKIVTICGCGNQGKIQLRSLLSVRQLEQAFAYDTDIDQAKLLAKEFSRELSVEPITKENLAASVRKSDICVTCTPSRQYFLSCDDISPGTFIAAVGADSEEKQELDPGLFISNKIVVDVLEQCIAIGDLHHAFNKGLVRKSDVHAELGEVVAGKKQGRMSDSEIIIFDSTGMALQDAAAAVLVYEKAIKSRIGTLFNFN
jgi:alanine dehydrogenase